MSETNSMHMMVFNIQRYSVHDGPGIRTTVFLKGCNMRCIWCENPESLSAEPKVAYHPSRCINCGECKKAFPKNEIGPGSQLLNDPMESNISRSVEKCPSGALEVVGESMTVDDVVKKLLSDREYFEGSGGGVTISGGEASLQFNALKELLHSLRSNRIHTVLQTNGLMPWEKMEQLATLVSLFHFDIKGVNSEKHRANTAYDNALILENARKLQSANYPVVFRIPLIPGFNDSDEDISDLSSFLDSIQAVEIDIIPYHNMGEDKIDVVGMDFPKLHIASMEMDDAYKKAINLISPGRHVTVSGSVIKI